MVCHFLLQGNLPDPGIETESLTSLALASSAGRFFTTEPPGKPPFLSLGKNRPLPKQERCRIKAKEACILAGWAQLPWGDLWELCLFQTGSQGEANATCLPGRCERGKSPLKKKKKAKCGSQIYIPAKRTLVSEPRIRSQKLFCFVNLDYKASCSRNMGWVPDDKRSKDASKGG